MWSCFCRTGRIYHREGRSMILPSWERVLCGGVYRHHRRGRLSIIYTDGYLLKSEDTGLMSMDLKEQYDKLYRYCYLKLHNREKAEDITQESFLRLWESGHYRDTDHAMQYLYTIARNLCIDAYRRSRYDVLRYDALRCDVLRCDALMKENPEKAGDQASDSSFQEKVVTALTLREALDTLEEANREILLLRFVNDMPIHIIGSLLGISRFAVYRRINRAIRQLREILKE